MKEENPKGLERARQQGREAFGRGKSLEYGNPYVAKTYRDAWADGWCEAAGGREEGLEREGGAT